MQDADRDTLAALQLRTDLPWGFSVLDGHLGFGAMIVSPPPKESLRRVQAREFGFTSRRVAEAESDIRQGALPGQDWLDRVRGIVAQVQT